MEILKYGVIVIMALFSITFLYLVLLREKGIGSFLLSAILSIITLFILNLTQGFTGVGLPINYFTVIGSGAFGFPAICSFLILQLIFI